MFQKKLIFEQEKPFTIFKIEDFLDPTLYGQLYKDFPSIPGSDITEYTDLKFGFSDSSHHYKNLIESSSPYKKFHEIIYSKSFFNFFYKKLFTRFLRDGSGDYLRILKLLRLPTHVNNKDDLSNNIFKKIIFNKIKIGIQFSYLKKGGRIDPHVDGLGKLLSLMLYFPDSDIKEEKNLGTSFYASKIKNHKNLHYTTEELRDNFFTNSSLCYKSEFIKNRLYGFIRKDSSWHSVNEVLFGNNDYFRKSININFYI